MSEEMRIVYDLEGNKVAEATIKNGEVVFPPEIPSWSPVLDCTHEPYADQSMEDNVKFAAHIHKKFILMKPA